MERKKTVSESQAEIAQVMMPSDANPAGNVHGGVIMKMIDEAAAIPALRHSQKIVVTASVDKIDFISPVYVGNLVIAKASVNYVGNSRDHNVERVWREIFHHHGQRGHAQYHDPGIWPQLGLR